MLPAMTDALHDRLQGMRVQALLDASPAVLPCLIRHGFTPLENPVMRRALAPTVTLAQAARLRGLAGEELDALLGELAEVCPCP